MRGAVITFLVGAAALAGVGVLTLSQAPLRLVRTGLPGVPALGPGGPSGIVASGDRDPTLCQPYEVLPAGVTDIRVSMWAFYGVRVRVAAFKDQKLLTEGRRGGNWTSDSVTVPIRPLRHTVSGVKLCVIVGPNSEPLLLLGPRTNPQISAAAAEGQPAATLTPVNARLLYGRVVVEYLAPGKRSWFSRLLSVARHLGLGRFYSGTWIALLLVALMTVVGALSVRVTLREMR